MRKLFTQVAFAAATTVVVATECPAQTLWADSDADAPRLLNSSVIQGRSFGLESKPNAAVNRQVRFDDDLIPLDNAPPDEIQSGIPIPPLPHSASAHRSLEGAADSSYFESDSAAHADCAEGSYFGCTDLGLPGFGLGGCESLLSGCRTGCRHWSENVLLFSGVDAWKNRADDDGQNNFGLRNGINVGVPIGLAPNIGFQFGGAWGVYDLQGREFGNTAPAEHHLYGTAGLFKRSDVCCGDRISWGVAWDYLNANNFGQNGNQSLDLNQLRSQLGYAIGERDELGFRGAWGLSTDTITAGGPTFLVDVVDQYDLYWKHVWQTGATTDFYVGAPGGPTNLGEVVLGFNGQVPLNDYVSMYGGAHLIPGSEAGNPPGVAKRFAEDLWNVSAGFEFSLGGKARARNVSGNRWMPLMPVAGFGNMSFQTPANTDL